MGQQCIGGLKPGTEKESPNMTMTKDIQNREDLSEINSYRFMS
jgi:hypothetical protein